jgi:hypothetical protein
MKAKDTIAIWLLALFILVPFGKAFVAFEDSLRSHRSVGTILGYLGLTILIAASGLFLIRHFIHLKDDLEHYESENRWREKERLREFSE